MIYGEKCICHDGLAEGEMRLLSREASRLHLLPITGCHFGAFSQLTSLELSAWDLGNLSQLPSFAGLVSALRSSVCFQRRIFSHVQHPYSGMVFSAGIYFCPTPSSTITASCTVCTRSSTWVCDVPSLFVPALMCPFIILEAAGFHRVVFADGEKAVHTHH